jgi:hypothetical protein
MKFVIDLVSVYLYFSLIPARRVPVSGIKACASHPASSEKGGNDNLAGIDLFYGPPRGNVKSCF